MPVKDDPLHDLWTRAKAGDRPATTDLATAVRPWLIRQARIYQRKFGGLLPADDLINTGYEKLPVAIASYDPAKASTFLGYFATLAGRGMVEQLNREMRHGEVVHVYQSRRGVNESPAETDSQSQALGWLTPIERAVVQAMAIGYDSVKPKSLKRFCVFLHITEAEALPLLINLKRKVNSWAERGRRTGKKRNPRTTAIAAECKRRRAAGQSWASIAKHIHLHFGQKYSANSLKVMTARAKTASQPI